MPKNKTVTMKGKLESRLCSDSKTGIKLGFKHETTRITRSSANGRVNSGPSGFTGPLTRSKARLLHKKKDKLTKNTPDPVVYHAVSLSCTDPNRGETPEPQQNIKMVDEDLTVGKSTRFIQPDYYLPDHDLFIEVKSRSYNCHGTASEKLDHIVRKYSKLEFTDNYKNSKLLIVCSAYELFEESTSELLNYNNKTSRKYIKDFVQLSKKYNIFDWIPIHKINNYL
jgi:hypothetical protein